MSLEILRKAYERHVEYADYVNLSSPWGENEYRSNWARDNWWLSVSPPIEEDASPFKGCVAARFLYEDGGAVVIRKITFNPEENDNRSFFWGLSDNISAKRRVFVRSSISSIIGEMIDSVAWRPLDDEINRAELIDKISSTYNAMMAARTANLEFTWHDSVEDAYRSWNEVSYSCMTGSRSQNTEVYDRTIGGKRIWAGEARDASGAFIGRFICYKPVMARSVQEVLDAPSIQVDDKPFAEGADGWVVHRIYGSGQHNAGCDRDGYTRVAGELMKAYPWLKFNPSTDGSPMIAAKIPSSRRLPYLDHGGCFIVRGESAGDRIIICFGEAPDTMNGWSTESADNYEGGFIIHGEYNVYCDDCGGNCHEDDVTYIGDRNVCPSCLESDYTYCEITGEHCRSRNAVEIVSGDYSGTYINRDELPYSRRNTSLVLAENVHGDSVCCDEDDTRTVWSNGDEQVFYMTDSDYENHVRTATVIIPRFTSERGMFVGDFTVTDETMDVFMDDPENPNSRYVWRDDNGAYYVYGRAIPFNGPVKAVVVGRILSFFKEGGHDQIGMRASAYAYGMMPISLNYWQMVDPHLDTVCSQDWTYTFCRNVDGFDVNVSCTSIDYPRSAASQISSTTIGSSLCINNEDRFGRARIVMMGQQQGDDDWCCQRITVTMHRSNRISPGRYKLVRMDDNNFMLTCSDGRASFLGGMSAIRINIQTNSMMGVD